MDLLVYNIHRYINLFILLYSLQGTPLAIEPTIEAHDPDYTFNETIKLSFDGK